VVLGTLDGAFDEDPWAGAAEEPREDELGPEDGLDPTMIGLPEFAEVDGAAASADDWAGD